jgi:hypothetical protein
VSEGREQSEGGEQDQGELGGLTPEEREVLEAAAALALTPDAGPMPDDVRAKVAEQARAHFGKRAKEHARARAETRAPDANVTPANAASTTAAGSHVVVALDEARSARSRSSTRPSRLAPFATWGGWGVAAAAVVLLAVRSSGSGPVTPASQPAPPPQRAAEQRMAKDGTEVRFDRSEGLGVVTLPAAAERRADEMYELWASFEGDAAPRLVATAPVSATRLSFGPICRPARALGGAERCAPLSHVVVTKEVSPGVATLREAAVIARVVAPAAPAPSGP